MPAALARQPVTVLRLVTTSGQIIALLEAGTGAGGRLLAAWSADNARHWTLSPPLALADASLASASFGPAGTAAVMTTGDRADVITSTARHGTLCPPCPQAPRRWPPTPAIRPMPWPSTAAH